MAGIYANFANVSHSDYEFTITFARVDHEVESEEVPGVVVSRVNLSPRFMRELIDAMEDNWSKWQTREGSRTSRSSSAPPRSLIASAWPIRSMAVGWVPSRNDTQPGGSGSETFLHHDPLLEADQRVRRVGELEREAVGARLDLRARAGWRSS